MRPVLHVCAATALLGACVDSGPPPPILLYRGTGTSPNDVEALRSLLERERLPVATAGAVDLALMKPERLAAHRLLIVPGGDFEAIGKGLDAATGAKIRSAVLGGLGYLGICAGAFYAGKSGLDLTGGVSFGFYAAERSGVRKAAVRLSFPDRPALEQYWEDGPELSGWGGEVARYPDLKPAVVQGRFGEGWVLLSGVHPEAPESWRSGMRFSSTASGAHALAATWIRAALDRRPLPEFARTATPSEARPGALRLVGATVRGGFAAAELLEAEAGAEWQRAHLKMWSLPRPTGASWRVVEACPKVPPKGLSHFVQRWRGTHACTAQPVANPVPFAPGELSFGGSCKGGDRYLARVFVAKGCGYELHVDAGIARPVDLSAEMAGLLAIVELAL